MATWSAQNAINTSLINSLPLSGCRGVVLARNIGLDPRSLRYRVLSSLTSVTIWPGLRARSSCNCRVAQGLHEPRARIPVRSCSEESSALTQTVAGTLLRWPPIPRGPPGNLIDASNCRHAARARRGLRRLADRVCSPFPRFSEHQMGRVVCSGDQTSSRAREARYLTHVQGLK